MKIIFDFENDLKKSFINVLFDNIIIIIDLKLKHIILDKIIIYEKFIIIK